MRFDVSDRAADFSDDNIGFVISEFMDAIFDFVGDVWNHLNGLTQEFATSFLFNDRQVDLPCRIVGIASKRAVSKSFVMTQVQIRFTAIIKYVDFAVLVGTHRSRVHVDVRVEFLHFDRQSMTFKQKANRGTSETFSEGTNDSTGYKDMFGHTYLSALHPFAVSHIMCVHP